jgi:uncharacterized membrane protein
MNDLPHIAWLYGQLAALVEDGTLSAEAAARLRQRYGAVETASGSRRAITLFGLLGATLIGGGVILLLAHNWDELSRPVRAFLSMLPLLAGQGLCLWTLLRRADSAAWREGSGAFLTMAIGASIALVSQTYHTGGAFEDFMLAWVLLALPIAYLMQATLPAILYLAGIVVWQGSLTHGAADALFGLRTYGYWVLLALALPWWRQHLRFDRYRSRAALFGWALALSAPIGFAISAQHVFDASKSLWPLWASAPAAVMFLSGMRWWRDAPTPGQGPFQTVGGLGSVALSFALSFEDIWRPTLGSSLLDALQAQGATIAFGALAVAIGLWADSLRRGAPAAMLIGALPIVTAAGCLLAGHSATAPMLLFNLYILAISVALLAAGLRAHRLGVVNAGMVVLSGLILCRFFDADIGFVARGLAFIVVGAGFLIANLVLLRKMGAAK